MEESTSLTFLSLSQSISPLTIPTTATADEATKLLMCLRTMKRESARIAERSQTTLALLSLQQAEVQRCLSGLRVLISPARKVPPELIRNIFEHCIVEEPTHISLGGNSQCTSLVLGQICRGWRAVALSTSSLWSTFHVEIPQNIQDIDASRIAKLLALWTSRSRPFPLNIRLTIFPVFYPYRERPRFRKVRGTAIRAVFAPILLQST